MKLKLQATPEEVVRAVEALEEYARAQGLSDKTIFGLALALEKCGINIVKHAYQCDAQQSFQVLLERNGDLFIIELGDHGSEFDPTAVAPREGRQWTKMRRAGGVLTLCGITWTNFITIAKPGKIHCACTSGLSRRQPGRILTRKID